MIITLERFAYLDTGTFGRLAVGHDQTFYTVEAPWKNNQPFISCIPEGLYELQPHDSRKYGEVYALVNPEMGVTHYKEQSSLRYACLLHVANWPKDVQGCIGPGMSYGIRNNEMQVISSRDALEKVLAFIDELVITHIDITHREAVA